MKTIEWPSVPSVLETELEWQTRTVELRLAQCAMIFVLVGIGVHLADHSVQRFLAGFYQGGVP